MVRRVVVTGVGLVTAVGLGTEQSWQAVLAGQSGVDTITRFDLKDYSCTIAAEVKGFDPLRWIEKKEIKKMGLFIQFALAAADFALSQAGLKVTDDIAD